MDDTYDTVILGTGLKETILAGLLCSVADQKVMVIDRNEYYGGESASLNLNDLCKKFGGSPSSVSGNSRDYNVDLSPKFLLSAGDLVKMLLRTGVSKSLDFFPVSESFVWRGGEIHKVPVTSKEMMKSKLVSSLGQKKNFKNLFEFVEAYEVAGDESTHKGRHLDRMTAGELLKQYKLDANSMVFVGHVMACYQNDDYLDGSALELVQRLRLYAESMGDNGSPFIYPKYGLGVLPEAYVSRCAQDGGVFVMGKEVEGIKYDDAGVACGVTLEGGATVKCNQVVGDPSFFIGSDRIRQTGQVVRCIAFMDHPIKGTSGGGCQIVLPGAYADRSHDIYVSQLSSDHCVVPKGLHAAMISTISEYKDPQDDIEAAVRLLGDVQTSFVWASPLFAPTDQHDKDGVFVSSSADASMNFQSIAGDVLQLFERLTGESLKL